MREFTEYAGPKIRLGIDDLKSVYAFHGNSQGDETRTNDVGVFHKSGGWLSINPFFKNVDCASQEAVDKMSFKISCENLKYIEKLKSDGRYGEYTDGVKIFVQHDPLYDDCGRLFNKPKVNYRLDVLDLNSIK